MSDHDEPHRLPSTPQWQNRVMAMVRALVRDALRYRDLTNKLAPLDLNTPHLDYLLRPSFVRQIGETVTHLADALYHVELRARYHGHRPTDQATLNEARKHLMSAARALNTLARRGTDQ